MEVRRAGRKEVQGAQCDKLTADGDIMEFNKF